MEKVKYSIIACTYGNPKQLMNFLLTAFRQDFKNYEVILVDNAGPEKMTRKFFALAFILTDFLHCQYMRIEPSEKRCRNISQGINIAAREARGENLIIIADPCVLLSHNLVSTIDRQMSRKILISGAGTDLKISPEGTYDSEYQAADPAAMSQDNENLLKRMGWPDDPLNLKLIPGTWRMPDPHNHFDVYVAAMPKSYFEPLPESGSWGDYWAKWLEGICNRRGFTRLSGVKIIHQYHRVWKNKEIA